MDKLDRNTELISKLKNGDQNSFKQLYFQYYPKLIGIAKKFNFNFLSPEDFVHETFLRVYNKRDKLKDDVLLDKQVFVICRNIILNHLKRENKNVPIDNFPDHLLASDKNSDLEEVNPNQLLLNSLIEKLPDKRKQIFIYHKIDQYSYEEISKLTKLSKKTIANHIYLANKFISNNFKKK